MQFTLLEREGFRLIWYKKSFLSTKAVFNSHQYHFAIEKPYNVRLIKIIFYIRKNFIFMFVFEPQSLYNHPHFQ